MGNNVKLISIERGRTTAEPRLLKTAQSSLGKLLRMYRERRRPRLTRLALATLVEVSDKTIRNWEDDISLPSSPHLRKLVEVYLGQNLFTFGEEQHEAQELWRNREDHDEHNTFPAFDSAWFKTLLQTKPTFDEISVVGPVTPIPKIPGNLPTLSGPTIGRQTELARLETWLQQPTSRLITLSGPGGGGKTRLALQVGHNLTQKFKDGIYFICLVGLDEPALVLELIAQTLEIKETGSSTLVQSIQTALRSKQLLLIIDNFEQVRQAGPDLLKLLEAAPGLKILVASRITLQVYGEQVFEVPTLALAPITAKATLTIKQLAEYGALKMLVEQAQRHKPDFKLTLENADVLNQICRKLDGLPLALQLAAARLKFFTPIALLRRLEGAYDSKPLDLLDKGNVGPVRQQSLRQALDWSYNLLNPTERYLFCTLGIFNDGGSLAAIEAVCAGVADKNGLKIERGQVLNTLTQLVEGSLLRHETGPDGEPRFLMLETVREYALERLETSLLSEVLWQKYYSFLIKLLEAAVEQLNTQDAGMARLQLEKEHNNLRGALRRALDTNQLEIAQRLVTSLGIFWEKQGYLSESERWLEELRMRTTAVSSQAKSGLAEQI